MHSLPLFVRLEGRPVILAGDGEAAGAKRALLERAGATIVGSDAAAALAIVAFDDPVRTTEMALALKARGVLVNAVDRPELCDFTLPAIIDRDPVLIAVGTGGASAGLAKALRQRLELLLPADLGALATALATTRAQMRVRWPDGRGRRQAIDAALQEGGPLDPLRADAAARVDAWLANDAAPAVAGTVEILVRSDDPDDLTLGQARLLAQADLIVYGPEVSPALLARGRADARRIGEDEGWSEQAAGLVVRLRRER